MHYEWAYQVRFTMTIALSEREVPHRACAHSSHFWYLAYSMGNMITVVAAGPETSTGAASSGAGSTGMMYSSSTGDGGAAATISVSFVTLAIAAVATMVAMAA
jgi:hypothetical protein